MASPVFSEYLAAMKAKQLKLQEERKVQLRRISAARGNRDVHRSPSKVHWRNFQNGRVLRLALVVSVIGVRLKSDERKLLERAAKKDGRTVSDWMRVTTLDRAN